jgi:hypothetical protein
MSHVDPFNAVGGYSVGIPPELVIDEQGNVVTNVNAPNANVTANRVYSNSYYWANGVPFTPNASAAGSNTQVQYNANGNFGASSTFTFNSTTNLLTVQKLQTLNQANLGNVGNVVILGGLNGYFLQTDGTGNLTWAPATGGNGGNGTPGGANTQVQFNDAGNFAGDAGFTYNKVDNTLTVSNSIAAGNSITGVNLAVTDATIYNNAAVTNITASNITLSANITNANWIFASYFAGNGHNLFGVVGANVSGQVAFANVANNVAGANVSGQVGFANVANNVAGANVTGQVANALVAGTVYTNAQPNITSVGNLTSLTVTGNTTLANSVTANVFVGNLFGIANLARNVTLGAQPNITSVGTLTSLTVSGNSTLGNSVSANYFVGNLYGTANVAVLATTANYALLANNANQANLANVAGTVAACAQPNITSLGTLTSLNVNGVANLGNVSNIKILGGTANYVLSTDGTGNLSWVPDASSNTSPGGISTSIQYNDSGSFAGSTFLTWNNSTKQLFVNGNTSATGFSNASVLVSTVATGSAPIIVSSTTPVANLGVATSDTVRNSAQPNITSVGTLTALAVSGNLTTVNANVTGSLTTSNISITGTLGTSNLNVTGLANFTSNAYIHTGAVLFARGNINTANSANVNLGNISNIHISGGINGYVLATDGAGNLYWSAGGGGGNGNPGGSNTQVQYNDNGAFNGSSFFTFNEATNNVQVAGNLIANSFTMGSGIYEFSYSNVYFATTSSTSPDQILLAIEADLGVGTGSVAAVEYTIISTDDIIRNFIKISCVRIGSSLNYTEYNTLPVNGYTGDFSVVYDAGNVVTPATIQLKVTPQSSNVMTHKMMVTTYYD